MLGRQRQLAVDVHLMPGISLIQTMGDGVRSFSRRHSSAFCRWTGRRRPAATCSAMLAQQVVERRTAGSAPPAPAARNGWDREHTAGTFARATSWRKNARLLQALRLAHARPPSCTFLRRRILYISWAAPFTYKTDHGGSEVDTSRPQRQAMAEGKIRRRGLIHGHYPGQRLPRCRCPA